MRWFSLALLLAIVGPTAWWLWSRPSTEAPPPAPPTAAPTTAPGNVPTPEARANVPAPERERENGPPIPTSRPAQAPQGWRGLLLDNRSNPLGDVQVHLLESAANEPLALPLILQQRLPLGPLTSTRSGSDGTFAIGLPVAQDKVYELFCVAPNHAPVRLAGLRMVAAEWVDLGAITLVPGSTVTGRVTIEGSGAPIPTAVLTLESGTGFVDSALRALPLTEHALTATVDATGRYEMRNVPRLGYVRLVAVAPGFARIVRGNIDLTGAAPVTVDFELPPGLTIHGHVRDDRNQPVAEARVEAWPAKSSVSPLIAMSDRDGRFAVQNLVAGAYRLRFLARGFQPHERTDVPAGTADLIVTVERRGSVRLRVLTPNGLVVRNYQMSLRRLLADRGEQLVFVADVPDQRIRLDAATDVTEVTGIPTGTFVCQVTCDGFATTLSPPFTIAPPTAGAPMPLRDVDVVVTTGATLNGIVVDEAGQPLAAATVTTQPDGADPEDPVEKLLAGASPVRTTARTATTDANGAFELPLLALGDYQLEVQHPEAVLTRLPGIRLGTPERRTVAPIRLVRGTLVAGRATIGGRTAAQMKIVLAVPSNAAGREQHGLRIETVTDPSGYFQLPRRVPPGMYEIRAAVVDTTDPEAQHFRQLQQLQRSAIPFTVAPGQDRLERDIDIPNDH